MKKLSLDLDLLQLESFSTARTETELGTVKGHLIYDTAGDGCSLFYSCQASVCGASCDQYGCGGSGAYTCGQYTRCGSDSIDICWTDLCR